VTAEAVASDQTPTESAGPMAAGPMAAGPMAAGPMAAGPMAAGPMAAGPMGPAAAAPTSGSAAAFKFDASRWSQADRIAGGATLVLLISFFLPWFSYRFGSSLISGTYSWNGLVHGYLYIGVIICLAILAYLVALAGFEQLPFKMPIGHEGAILIATVVNLLLTFIAFIDKPYGFGVGWSFGAFIALIAAVVAAAPLGWPMIQASRNKTSK